MATRDKHNHLELTDDDVKNYALKISSDESSAAGVKFIAEPADPNVTFFRAIRIDSGFTIRLGYALDCEFSSLAQSGAVDAFIVSTEDGFSPLGAARQFFSVDLGIAEKEISERADWNRSTNQRVTLIGLASRRPNSHLKGVILAPCGSSKCYEEFQADARENGSQEFYYHVTFAAISQASNVWGARRLALAHLSPSGGFDESIASANVQALAKFCAGGSFGRIESLIFVGCCIQPEHLRAVDPLDRERPFSSVNTETWTHLSWA